MNWNGYFSKHGWMSGARSPQFWLLDELDMERQMIHVRHSFSAYEKRLKGSDSACAPSTANGQQS